MHSQMNSTRTVVVQMHSSQLDNPSGLALCDGGADTGLLGDAFHIEEYSQRVVDVEGFDGAPGRQHGLSIGNGITAYDAPDGTTLLLRYNEGVIKPGKSLLASNQMRHFGHSVCDVPLCYGGSQCIITLDNYIIHLTYTNGLCSIPIRVPTAQELLTCTVVDLTSPLPWSPSSESETSPSHLTLDAFSAPSSGPDMEHIQRCLGWKPLDVIQKTLEATTQMANNTLRLPLRQHYKSRFPALNCRRLREVFATDTFFSSEKALGGATCAQIYVGKTSHLTVVFAMKTESQMADTLQDFIRQWGAPNGLLSDNSKTQTGAAVTDILRLYNIRDLQTEPHHPNQNLAERRIQEVKRTSNSILDRTGAPGHLWMLCVLPSQPSCHPFTQSSHTT
jgi:hypothetical protein